MGILPFRRRDLPFLPLSWDAAPPWSVGKISRNRPINLEITQRGANIAPYSSISSWFGPHRSCRLEQAGEELLWGSDSTPPPGTCNRGYGNIA